MMKDLHVSEIDNLTQIEGQYFGERKDPKTVRSRTFITPYVRKILQLIIPTKTRVGADGCWDETD